MRTDLDLLAGQTVGAVVDTGAIVDPANLLRHTLPVIASTAPAGGSEDDGVPGCPTWGRSCPSGKSTGDGPRMARQRAEDPPGPDRRRRPAPRVRGPARRTQRNRSHHHRYPGPTRRTSRGQGRLTRQPTPWIAPQPDPRVRGLIRVRVRGLIRLVGFGARLSTVEPGGAGFTVGAGAGERPGTGGATGRAGCLPGRPPGALPSPPPRPAG